MSRERGPVLKRARALGIEPQYLGVNKKSKRHPNQGRRKKSEYGIQLNEKQKVRFTYGLSETQFRNTYNKASKRAGGAGENLLIMLESRFDNIVFRMGFAATRREARQLVNHGHFDVNGIKTDIASYLVKPGDVITVREIKKDSKIIKENVEANKARPVPEWLEKNTDKLEAKVLRLAAREDVDLPVEEHLIVELYSK